MDGVFKKDELMIRYSMTKKAVATLPKTLQLKLEQTLKHPKNTVEPKSCDVCYSRKTTKKGCLHFWKSEGQCLEEFDKIIYL